MNAKGITDVISSKVKRMRTILCIIFLFAAFSLTGQKIIEALPRWMASAHANYIFPQEPINQFLKDNKPGFQFEFQYRVQYNKPFLAGGYYNEYTLSKHVLKYVESTVAGDIHIKEKAITRRIETGITAGFYPEINWLLQPYLQGRAGLAIFQTSSILMDNDSHEEIDRISEQTSTVPAYGIDVGVHIVPNIWYLRGDVRIGFVGNTSTTYMLHNEDNAGSSQYPIDYFDNYTSAGKWLKISTGVSFLF